MTTLVVGLGTTGKAVARHLRAAGDQVVVVEDQPSEASRQAAAQLGVELVEAPSPAQLSDLVRSCEQVVPSPGVPAHHGVYAAAAALGRPVISEVELAWRATTLPIVAITGTNGKTTVTTLVVDMLARSGLRALPAGNIGTPLVSLVDADADVLVAEVSSFQLQFTRGFRPHVALWLNLAEDHLDWHPSMAHYVAAKAKVWAHQGAEDTAVANADDPVVAAEALRAPGRVVTFGLGPGFGTGFGTEGWRAPDGLLVTPAGEVLMAASELPRALPHDVANALAAAAAATEAGATLDACRSALRSFGGLPHRVALVGDAGGVRYYDDSKATTPASVVAAVSGFDSVVLIAGGRNKGLQLDALGSVVDRVRQVVAIGEAADEVRQTFAGKVPVVVATSMSEAVDLAGEAAQPGDAVLLSPGCASFDWYRNYGERGDDFAQLVRRRLVAATGVVSPGRRS